MKNDKRLKWSEEEVREAVMNSYSYSGVLRYLNAGSGGSSHQWIKRRINDLNININHFTYAPDDRSCYNKHYKSNRIDSKLLLVFDNNLHSRRPRNQLLRAMIDFGMKYKCHGADCESPEPFWRGKPIVLDIDHIDGNWRNNTIENLRFLCPNCHAQEETSTSSNGQFSLDLIKSILAEKDNDTYIKEPVRRKSNNKKVKLCPYKECETMITERSNYCRLHANKLRSHANLEHISWPDDLALIKMILDSNFLQVSKQLGVSDNAIRKLLKNRDYDIKYLSQYVG